MSENSKTNIEYFNSYLKLFINNIIDTFPEYKSILEEYYEDLLTNTECNNDKYVKRFVKKMKEHKKLISIKDNQLFNESIFILKNVDFKNLWESGELSDTNKDKIWDYIHTLFIISETIMNDSETIKKLVESFKKLKEQSGESTGESTGEATGETTGEATGETTGEVDDEIFNMLKNLTNQKKVEPISTDFLENGLLGKLATELSSEINLDNMDLDIEQTDNVEDVLSNLISGDNPLKFMNLIQTVGQKIQSKVQNGDFKQEDLFNEAKKMMGNLQGSSNLFDNLLKQENIKPTNPTQERLKKKLEERKKK